MLISAENFVMLKSYAELMQNDSIEGMVRPRQT
jgi:hypothetical protein